MKALISAPAPLAPAIFLLGCLPLLGFTCDPEAPICGDGAIEGDEGCDDGDGEGFDGCDSECAVQEGWMCVGEPSECWRCCEPGWECGADSCGGSCGECPEGSYCEGDRFCAQDYCASPCEDRECGWDCGYHCGECDDPGDYCTWEGRCQRHQTWQDPDTGLTWFVYDFFPVGYDYWEARHLCADSQRAGHGGWRIPTIDELRTLVLGCWQIEPFGSCSVTEEACNEQLCEPSGDCFCGGEVEWSRSGEGCWGDPAVGIGSCQLFWSDTSAQPEERYAHWGLDFLTGSVELFPNESAYLQVRCVYGDYSLECANTCLGAQCGTVGGCRCGPSCPDDHECLDGRCVYTCEPTCLREDGGPRICGTDGCLGHCGDFRPEDEGFDCVGLGCCHTGQAGCYDGCDPEVCCTDSP